MKGIISFYLSFFKDFSLIFYRCYNTMWASYKHTIQWDARKEEFKRVQQHLWKIWKNCKNKTHTKSNTCNMCIEYKIGQNIVGTYEI